MHKNLRFFASLVVLFACQMLAHAQDYTITGSIQDAQGNGIGGQLAIRTTTGEFVTNVQVNGDGSATTSEPIPAGQYVVFANLAVGFVEEVWGGGEPANIACPNLSCNLPGGATIDLSSSNVIGIDFILEPIVGGGRLSGNVSRPDGITPVVGVSMLVLNANGEYINGATTDTSGNFITPPLSDGDVYLRSENDAPGGLAPELWNNFVCAPIDLCFDPSINGTAITIAGADVGGLDFQLDVPTGGQVVGTFEDLDFGFPLADMNVELLDISGNFVTNVPTDATGTYTFAGLADGQYKVFISGPTEGYPQYLVGAGSCSSANCDVTSTGILFTVAGGGIVNVGPLQVPYEGGPRITGIITRTDPAGEPVSSRVGYAGVDLFDTSGNFIGSGPTDRSGRYQLVPPGGAGEYVLITAHDRGFHGLIDEIYDNIACGFNCDPNDPARTVVTVPNTGSLTAIADFVLDTMPTVSGTVFVDDGSSVNAASGDMQVLVLTESLDFVAGSPVAQDGTWSVNVPPGSYLIAATPFTPGTYQQYVAEFSDGSRIAYNSEFNLFSRGIQVAPPTPFAVNGDTSGVDITLEQGVTIQGTLSDENTSAPLTGGVVTTNTPTFDRELSYGFVREDGTYFVAAFPAEEYLLFHSGFAVGYGREIGGVNKCLRDGPGGCDAAVAASPPEQPLAGDQLTLDLDVVRRIAVSGTVGDDGGNPVEGIRVRLRVAADDYIAAEIWTDANGNWFVDNVAPGSYYLTVRGEDLGFGSQIFNDGGSNACANEFCDFSLLGTLVENFDGLDKNAINFSLAPLQEFTISGSIKDADGNGIGGQIAILDPGTGNQVAEVFVDGEGNGTTPPIPAGQYLAYAGRRFGAEGFVEERWDGGEPNNLSCPNLNCDVLGGTLIDLTAGAVSGIDFVLDPISGGGRLSGNVQDSLGNPVVGVTLAVLNASGYQIKDLATDRFGNFGTDLLSADDVFLRVQNDAPGGLAPELWNGGEPNNTVCVPFDLCFDLVNNATPISLALGDVGALDFQLEVPAGGQVVGTFEDLDFGFPLADMNVELLDINGNFVAAVPTDATGTYTFAGLADGQYKVFISGPTEGYPQYLKGVGSCNNGCDTVNSGDVFTVTDGGAANAGPAQVPYEGGPRITGIIIRSDTGEPAVTLPNATLGANIFDSAGNLLGGFGTDRGGRYQVQVDPGDYIPVTFNDQGLLNETFDNVPCDFDCGPGNPNASAVNVPADGTLTGVADFGLDLGRTISGVVRSEADQALIPGATVCIGFGSDASNRFRRCELTDAQGRFAFGQLGSIDDYVVGVIGFTGEQFFSELFENAACCEFAQATTIDTTFGDQDIVIDVAKSASIRGSIFQTGTNTPIEGVAVDILDASCNRITRTRTDASGNYSAGGFGEGNYYVYAAAGTLGFVPELFPNLKRLNACSPDSIEDGTVISVSSIEDIFGVDFGLDRGASISGVVSDINGPLPPFNAQIRLYALDGTQLFVGSNGFFRGAFGEPENGYLVQGLPAGDYNVVLSGAGQTQGLVDEVFDNIPCPRNSCPPGTGATISLTPGDAQTGIDAVLETGSQISGQLTTADGSPLQTCIAIYNAEGVYAAFACSDANGNYTTRNGLPAGNYLVSNQFNINAPQPVDGGYLPTVWPGRACGEPCNFLLGDPVAVDGTNETTNINLIFQTGSSISGQVTGDGNPAGGVEVRLLRGVDGSVVRTTTSAQDGTYVFDGLAAGDYRLRTSNGLGFNDQLYTGVSCNPFCDPLSGLVVSLAADSEQANINFALASAPSIVGSVLDDQGQSVGNVRVEAYNSLGARVGTSTSGADGSFAIGNLYPSTLYVRTANTLGFVDALHANALCPAGCNPVADGTPISVGSSGQFPAGGLQLQLGSASRLFGVVRTGTSALSAVNVEVYTPSGVLAATGETGDDGAYSTEGLAPGSYHVVTRNNQGFIDEGAQGTACPISCAPTTTAAIQIQTNQAFELDFSLAPGASISGRVVDEGDNPLPSVTVAVYEDTGREVSRAVTDSGGNYRIGALLPADYFARTTRNLAGLRNQLFDSQACDSDCDPLNGSLITLASGAARSDVNFVLPAGNSISGQITDASAAPLGGVQVVAVNASGIQEATAITGADGAYTISGLVNGSYTLRTFNSLGYIDQAIGGDECTPRLCLPASATTYALQDTDVTGANAQLRFGQFLSGTATDDEGNPIFSGDARLYSDQAELLKTTPIDEGFFVFSGLAGGTYYAVVTNDLGLVDQAWTGPTTPGLDCPDGSCLSCLTTNSCAAPPEGPAPIQLAAPASLNANDPSIAYAWKDGRFVFKNPKTESDLSFELPSGELLTGQVINASGDPIPGITIYFFNEQGADAGSAVSDGQGNFESTSAFGSGSWFASTRKLGTSGALGFINELFDDVACFDSCSPVDVPEADPFQTPNAPAINFQLNRMPTERIFGSGFEF